MRIPPFLKNLYHLKHWPLLVCRQKHSLDGNSLAVQRLGLHTYTAMSTIPGQETKILQAEHQGQNKQTNKQTKHASLEMTPCS